MHIAGVLLTVAHLLWVQTPAVAWSQTPAVAQTEMSHVVSLRDARVHLIGRFADLGASPAGETPEGAVRIAFPGTGFIVQLRGDQLALRLNSRGSANGLTLVIDHGEARSVVLQDGQQTVPLLEPAAGQPIQKVHTVEVYKQSETWQGLIDLESLAPGPGTLLLEAPKAPERKLLFVGDSVTCGSGVARDAQCTDDPAHLNSDPYDAFGMVVSRRLGAEPQLVCYGGRGLQRDYRGLSLKDGVLNVPDFLDLAVPADDSRQRRAWVTRSWVPDAIIVSVGTNDFNLESTQPLDPAAFVAKYRALLRRLRAEYTKAVILATEGAIVTDPRLRQYVQQAVQESADRRILWVPSTHYPGNSCDAHPTREQHARMAADLEPYLLRELGW